MKPRSHSLIGAFAAALAALFIAGGAARELAASKSDTREMWAGHQVVFGQTDVPVLGKRETRSDSYVLAEVTREDGRITITQTACKVNFKEVLGTKVRISEKALLSMPPATFSFVPEGDLLKAAPWTVGWGRQDVDRDGQPGLTVDVDASICGGRMFVSGTTKSAAMAKMLENGNGMKGKISVRVRQKILDADSACLKMFAADSDEIQTGGFIYLRVPDNSTCETLLKRPWPIEAKVKR